MKNYFHILGIKAGATEDEIRKAYRAFAKQHHPDVNDNEEAHKKFIEAHEAYQFLINKAQRRNYEVLLSETRLTQNELDRRELIYKLWIEHQQKQGRIRNAMHAVGGDDQQGLFGRRVWRGVNLLWNLFFMTLFVLILCAPISGYMDNLKLPEAEQRPLIYYLVPAILGLVFICYGYYYWFILKTDER